MNTLFTRTLLWFIVTVILTFIAMTVAAALDVDPEDRRRPFGALLAVEFTEARYAYEIGGAPALRATLERFLRATGAQGVLTDGFGRDLLTGEVRTDLVAALGQRRRGRFFSRDKAVIAGRSVDGAYLFFLMYQRASWFRWFLQPEVNLTMLAVLAVFSFAFARYLTNPVRRLQAAVECFGRGDLQARVRSDRKDEIGQLARTFDQMADRIETLLAAERRLLLDISHELRSPLARLTVALELARTDTNNAKHLDRIQKEIERLSALVGELLQVTRAEGDAGRMLREPVALEALLREIADDVQVEAEARGSHVELETPEPVTVEADPELLRRAVENVVRNATRYAPPGTPVQMSLSRNGANAHVVIRDFGPGVPANELASIFDPFYRVESDRARMSGGVGLGLAIAKRAVELHHGRISARNADPGLLVDIEVPV